MKIINKTHEQRIDAFLKKKKQYKTRHKITNFDLFSTHFNL